MKVFHRSYDKWGRGTFDRSRLNKHDPGFFGKGLYCVDEEDALKWLLDEDYGKTAWIFEIEIDEEDIHIITTENYEEGLSKGQLAYQKRLAKKAGKSTFAVKRWAQHSFLEIIIPNFKTSSITRRYRVNTK